MFFEEAEAGAGGGLGAFFVVSSVDGVWGGAEGGREGLVVVERKRAGNVLLIDEPPMIADPIQLQILFKLQINSNSRLN